jgi:hypothetical protein
MMFRGVQLGSKYAAGLGGVTLLFCALEEAAGAVRERLLGARGEKSQAQLQEASWLRQGSWRQGAVGWEDGVVAGGTLGLGICTLCESSRIGMLRLARAVCLFATQIVFPDQSL